MWIVRLALQRPYTFAVMALLIVVLGATAITQMRTDIFPEIDIPVVTVIGLQVGVLFTGAILTETIFSWPGIGKWLIEAIFRRDYPVLQGGLLLVGAIVMSVNLFVDLTYGFINPRIRHNR